MQAVEREPELWKVVPGYEGYYEVSSWGNVRSVDRDIWFERMKRYRHFDSQEIKQQMGKNYLHVTLYQENKGKGYDVHRLAGITFIDNPENLPCINHKDGNKTNNYYKNLEWATHSENIQHAYDNGLLVVERAGTKNSRARLTEVDAKAIREELKDKSETDLIGLYKNLAEKYGVKKATLYRIKVGTLWKHI